jgi:transmembrane sensor
MKREDLEIAFDQYLAGKASVEQIAQLLDYFHLEKESAILAELILGEMEKPEDDKAYNKQKYKPLFDRVQTALNNQIDQDELKVVPIRRRLFYRLAGAAILLLGVGLAIWKHQTKPVEMLTVQVPMGQLKQITLSDSSKVWLNAGSIIEYPAKFSGKTRVVTIKEGEAYFEVVHDAQLPFVVKTAVLGVTVLGTSFDVKAFKNEGDIRITVASGKVGVNELNSKVEATYLLPNQQVIFLKSNRKIQTTRVNAEIGSWRSSRLVFDNEALDRVLNTLERKYKVHFQIQRPELLEETTSMKLDNQPITDVLTVLSFSKHFNYSFSNDSTIVIK